MNFTFCKNSNLLVKQILLILTILCSKYLIYFNNKLFINFNKLKNLKEKFTSMCLIILKKKF